jgi:hypothetical protein
LVVFKNKIFSDCFDNNELLNLILIDVQTKNGIVLSLWYDELKNFQVVLKSKVRHPLEAFFRRSTYTERSGESTLGLIYKTG